MFLLNQISANALSLTHFLHETVYQVPVKNLLQTFSHNFQVLREKLKYAIHFCKSIDTDDYARIALTGDPLEDASDEDGSESDGIESVTDSDGEIVESDEE